MSEKKKIAVVGGGIAGVLSAWLLSKKHEVTMFEKNDYLGGHTNTIEVNSNTAIDTGFIVLNDKTYPTLHSFLQELEVPVRYADMSFSLVCDRSGLQYSSKSLNTLFGQRKNLFNVRFIKMLFEIKRFWKIADLYLKKGISLDLTLEDFLEKESFNGALLEDYLIPMTAAIWSCSAEDVKNFPLTILLHFFANHGLLGYYDQPKWQTVKGGSYQYVKAFKDKFKGELRIATPVKSIKRVSNDSVEISYKESVENFDQVVIACHADQVLNILSDATKEEKEFFSKWSYQKNHTVLHTDKSFLPKNPLIQASWNYRREVGENGVEPLSITYDMNRLQGVVSSSNYCVTLNSRKGFDSSLVIKEIDYYHPHFTTDAVKTQSKIREINGDNSTFYCGSYLRFGFHEDAAMSAYEVAKSFGVDFEIKDN